MHLPRLKPQPVPAVHPVPEYAVEGQRAEWYAEMKAALQVPWMVVGTMPIAHYPTIYACLWQGRRPLVVSQPFVEEALGLQEFVETRAAELSPPPIVRRLAEFGYGAREIDQIRDVNAVFSHGNHFYALIATAARVLLEEGAFNGPAVAPAFTGRHAPDVAVPFVLLEAHHADPPTKTVYEDVTTTLGLPFINTDYRAFARWPSYWAAAWGDLRTVAGMGPHELICAAYHDRLCTAVTERLPNPGGLTAAALRAAAKDDATLDEVLAVVRLFQWLLPGLAVNVAFLKAQLADD
ncbi:MAG: hypothetical protein VW405_04820 [Rhodospirillaceae bacterium]